MSRMRHHMNLRRLAPEGAMDALSQTARADNITPPQLTDDDDEPCEATPDGMPAGKETRWRCVDCEMEGTMEEFRVQDCPQGMAPYYSADEPTSIVLAECDEGLYVRRYSVSRLEVYESDENYDRARELKGTPEAEVLRRLGDHGGHWHPYSKVDDKYMCTTGVALMREHGVAPQGANPNSNVCSIGFSEREQKWYGWSHRALCGFPIGYVAEEGHVVLDYNEGEEASAIPVGFECKTIDDCKRCAVAYAESVG